MIRQLVEWFEQEACSAYAGIDCNKILEDNPLNRALRCPQLVQATLNKVDEILSANGYSLLAELNY
jgi:hypothetical protein